MEALYSFHSARFHGIRFVFNHCGLFLCGIQVLNLWKCGFSSSTSISRQLRFSQDFADKIPETLGFGTRNCLTFFFAGVLRGI